MTDLTASQKRALEAAGCELRTDALTRCLYAVDASIYQIEPAAVAFPKSAREAARLLHAAAENGVEITPRGAGTGLAGGALGSGLVVDFARRNRRIEELDVEAGTVRVGAGVVLDQLNAFLAAKGLWFGPDVATSSRATLGGMIANNSSGAHAPVYGTTADHLEAVEVVLTDGSVTTVSATADGLADVGRSVDHIVAEFAEEIAIRFPEGLTKRWPGYAFDRLARSPGDLTNLISGSEGTLAGISSAVLRVVPLPFERSLGVLFFASVEEALQATVDLADLGAAAIEHLDYTVLDQTRGQRAFAPARALLDLDDKPCRAILLVEFFDDGDDRLGELDRRKIGDRRLMCRTRADQELVWGMRRAGLSLLTGCKGPAKPVAFIEDVCVLPDRLPDYVAGLREIFDPLGLEASFYGHAASGELHVRPILDLHRGSDIAKLRQVADQVSDLCQSFGGSLAAEHGVGLGRTEFLERHIGSDLMAAARRIKALFDPDGVMNPGKIVGDGRYRIDQNLRLGDDSVLSLPFTEHFEWIGRDEGFIANLEQCNGCGGCRKAPPTMCPTFAATGDEALSTRGRANIVRAALEGRFGGSSTLAPAELEEVLESCLSCKACVTECPSNVDMARIKAELRHARHQEQGVSLADRLIANADLLGKIGTTVPGVANALMSWQPLRILIEGLLGVDRSAPLPPFAQQRFDRWFDGRAAAGEARRRVFLWDDTWMRYHEAGIGKAAIEVLEAAGFEVLLVEGRVCCGRPAASRGLLDSVRRAAAHNIGLLTETKEPVIFLEPSCWSMFRDEYRQLGIKGADAVADRCVLFEDFVADLLDRQPDALTLSGPVGHVALHGHCHAKALSDARRAIQLCDRMSGGTSIQWLETGCCGMAGAFGMMRDHRDLSMQVAAPLVAAIEELPADTTVIASGTSCRHQIADQTDRKPVHLAEFLARHLERPS